MSWMPHLIAAPILLPLLTAALMLMLGEKHRPLKARINLFSSLLGLGISVLLLQWTQAQGVPGSIGVYLPGNWQAPFGIVLVVDRLSALMLVLTGIIGVSALLFAGEDRVQQLARAGNLRLSIAANELWRCDIDFL